MRVVRCLRLSRDANKRRLARDLLWILRRLQQERPDILHLAIGPVVV